MSLAPLVAALCEAIRTGAYSHVPRVDIEAKNWLATGRVTREDVIALLTLCTERDHTVSDHHSLSRIKIHEFKIDRQVVGTRPWYLKFYFQPNNPGQGWKVFSVHPSS